MKNTFKKIFAILTVFVLVVSMFACSSSKSTAVSSTPSKSNTSNAQKAAGKKYTIGYYGIDSTQAFFKDVYDGLNKACAKRGWTLKAEFTNYDPVKMSAAYNDFKAEHVDFIIDGNAMQDISAPFAQKAATDKIPYLAIAQNLPAPTYNYGPANSDMGTAVGNYIGALAKKEWEGQIDLIILVGTFTTGPQITERLTSAVPVLGKYVQNINSVPVIKVDANAGDTQVVYQKVKDSLTSKPDAKHIAMFCQTDDMANAAFSAVSAAGRGEEVMGTGSDCSAVATDYFKKAIVSNNFKVPWRGSIYLGAINYGEALCKIIPKILNNQQKEYNITFQPQVAGIYNLYTAIPSLKNK